MILFLVVVCLVAIIWCCDGGQILRVRFFSVAFLGKLVIPIVVLKEEFHFDNNVWCYLVSGFALYQDSKLG